MKNSPKDIKKRDYIFGSLLTGVYDVNRKETLNKNDFSLIQKWYDSIVSLKMDAIIFHNSFSKELIAQHSNQYIQFIQVDYDQKLNPNIYRYFIYQEYLKQYSSEIANLFVTDISDVEVICNPFVNDGFTKNTNHLFCGDETEILDNEWMRNHCAHLRNLVPGFIQYEEQNKSAPLLNCGIIGGKLNIMLQLFDQMVELHKLYSYTNTTEYTLDMGVFNYAARTLFANKLMHGAPVNTVFKKYESHRKDCWFRHK